MRALAPLLLLALSCTAVLADPAPHSKRSERTPPRCTLRVTTHGLYVDGAPRPQAAALAECKRRRGGAMVVVEDDVPAAQWTQLQQTLRAQKIPFQVRGKVSDDHCFDNPLAPNCN